LAEIGRLAKKIVMPENTVETNKFELVFDECEEGAELRALLTNVPAIPIYNIEEKEEEYEDEEKENL
jgi:hypothetical protein